MRNAIVYLVGGLLLWAPVAGAAPRSWELREGRWQVVEAPSTQPIKDPVLDRVEQLLASGQYLAAKKIDVAWLKEHKEAPDRDRGLYLLGQANYLYGDRIMAFYNFDELLDNYADSSYFYHALQRQYDIAEAYLNGYKRRFLGIPMLSAEDEAIDMLFRIQQRAPGSPLAEKALLRTADYYYANSDFDLAADTYAAYARSYPRSAVLERVRLRQAFSSLAQFRGVKFDATPVVDARQQLIDLMAMYPQMARQENLPALVARIDGTLARKFYETADFYRRTDQPQAATYYYQYVMKTFPNSPEAEAAEKRLWKGVKVTMAQPAGQPATAPSNSESR